MNLLTLSLVNPRHHIDKLKGFAYALIEAFMPAYMKLLYPLCLVRVSNYHHIETKRYLVGHLKLRVGQGAKFLIRQKTLAHSLIL